jgi:hypothetical protein
LFSIDYLWIGVLGYVLSNFYLFEGQRGGKKLFSEVKEPTDVSWEVLLLSDIGDASTFLY